MPKSSPAKLSYQRQYNAQPENIKKRTLNNAARRAAIKDGKAAVGDGKDVDHVRPLDNGGGNSEGNLRVVSEATNRGWRKGKSGADSYNPKKEK
jgi:hypothetical protein